jgi:hypothetical protein
MSSKHSLHTLMNGSGIRGRFWKKWEVWAQPDTYLGKLGRSVIEAFITSCVNKLDYVGRALQVPKQSIRHQANGFMYLGLNTVLNISRACVYYINYLHDENLHSNNPLARFDLRMSVSVATDILIQFCQFINSSYVLQSQGCQIILGTTYHHGKNLPNNHKIYQTDTKYTKLS